MADTTRLENHRIIRSDGQKDSLTSTVFESYDAAYETLERYYRDFCCSDDDRIEYTIVTETNAMDSKGNGRGTVQHAGIHRTEHKNSLE